MKDRSRSSLTPTKRFKPLSSPREERTWTRETALRELRRLGEVRNVEGMARFGIRAKAVYGVAKPQLDALARRIGRNRKLAEQLWESGVHDARILAGMIDVASEVSASQMENWARCFDNWDVCDGTCCHLFVFAKPAWSKAILWSRRKEEFIKRAGFAPDGLSCLQGQKRIEQQVLESASTRRTRGL